MSYSQKHLHCLSNYYTQWNANQRKGDYELRVTVSVTVWLNSKALW